MIYGFRDYIDTQILCMIKKHTFHRKRQQLYLNMGPIPFRRYACLTLSIHCKNVFKGSEGLAIQPNSF